LSQLRTESIPKSRFSVYLGKAEEFQQAAETALKRGDHNAAAANAAHAVISGCDALVAFHLGLRCKGEDHREVVQLIRRTPAGDTRDKERQIFLVFDSKRVAEYEDRDVSEEEAILATSSAKRILDWVRSNLPQA
jgi:HEPN domain-containing protein